MAKEKKITIKYYVNYSVSPNIVLNTELHPIYVRITYNRETNNLRIFDSNDNHIFTSQKRLDPSPNLLEKLNIKTVHRAFQYDNLKKIIRFEINNFSEKFSLKKISARIYDYSITSIYEANGIRDSFEKYFSDQQIFDYAPEDPMIKIFKWYLLLYFYHTGSIKSLKKDFGIFNYRLLKAQMLLEIAQIHLKASKKITFLDDSIGFTILDYVLMDLNTRLLGILESIPKDNMFSGIKGQFIIDSYKILYNNKISNKEAIKTLETSTLKFINEHIIDSNHITFIDAK